MESCCLLSASARQPWVSSQRYGVLKAIIGLVAGDLAGIHRRHNICILGQPGAGGASSPTHLLDRPRLGLWHAAACSHCCDVAKVGTTGCMPETKPGSVKNHRSNGAACRMPCF